MDFDTLHIDQHLRLLYRRGKFIILCVTLVVLPLVGILALQEPTFETSLSLEVADDAITRILTSDIDVSPDLTVGNYMDMLTSQNFARRVVRAYRAKVDTLSPQERATREKKSVAAQFLSRIEHALGIAGAIDPQEEAVLDLLQRMETDHRGGQMIKVSVTSHSQDKAYLLAETVGEEFVELHLETLQKRIAILSNFYKEQIEQAYKRLVESKSALADFKRENDVSIARMSPEKLDARLENIESQLLDVSSERKMLESRMSGVHGQIENLEQKAPTLARLELQLPRIDELKNRLLNLKTRLNAQKTLYTEKHPKIQGLNLEIGTTLNELRSLAGNAAADQPGDTTEAAVLWHDLYVEKLLNKVELNAIKIKEAGLRSLAAEYRRRLFSATSEEEQQLLKHEREVEAAQDAYQGMLRTNEKVQGLEANKALNVNIIEPAERPIRPLPRRRPLKIFMGLMLGFMLGVGFAYLREALDRTLKTPEDIEKKLGVPVAGYIIDASEVAARRSRTPEQNVLQLGAPDSDIAENFRALRTMINFALAENENQKIIMVTSPGPGEGKSTIAMNLASSFTLFGKKTILLDADLYHPSSHTLLGIDENVGLSNWLANEIPPSRLQNSVQMNGSAMDIIQAGTKQINFQKLSIDAKMASLLKGLREKYDVIIIDAPPVVTISDPILLTPHVDLILMVLQSGQTELEAARKAIDLIQKGGKKPTHAVLNKLKVEKEYGPGSYLRTYKRSGGKQRSALLKSA